MKQVKNPAFRQRSDFFAAPDIKEPEASLLPHFPTLNDHITYSAV